MDDSKKFKPGIYKHYKGKMYKAHFIAKHSETLEDVVVYEPQYESIAKFWVRPLSMFLEDVTVDGKQVPRFQFVKEL